MSAPNAPPAAGRRDAWITHLTYVVSDVPVIQASAADDARAAGQDDPLGVLGERLRPGRRAPGKTSSVPPSS